MISHYQYLMEHEQEAFSKEMIIRGSPVWHRPLPIMDYPLSITDVFHSLLARS